MGWVDLSIRDFGAVGDGTTDDTDAIHQAIDFIRNSGGGKLTMDGSGASHYRTMPFELTSNMIFYIEGGATVSAIFDLDAWPIDPPFPSYGGGSHHSGFVGIKNQTNVTILGDGLESILDGNGPPWWERRLNGTLELPPGRLIQILYCKQIKMFNFKMIDSPGWNNHFYSSDDIHVKGVHIWEPEEAPFVDGWDPDSSSNVLIEDSTYHGGDDCVAIKAGSECFGIDYGKPSVNITIRNITCHGFSAGIAIGSEMSGGVENVTIENILFTKSNKPADIKVSKTRGGYVKNIIWRDITVTGTLQRAIHIDFFHYNDSPNTNCPPGWKPPHLTYVSNITFLRFDGRNASYVDFKHRANETFHFCAYDESPLKDIYLEDIYFPPNENGIDWNCSAVEGVIINGTVEPWPPCAGFTILDKNVTENVTNSILDQSKSMNEGFFLCLLLGVVLFTGIGVRHYIKRREANKNSNIW